MELDYRAIGKRIKIARIKSDMNQEKLAELVGVSPTHMSNIETGTTRVSLQTIVRLANALSVSVDDLLCDSVIKAKVQFEREIAQCSLIVMLRNPGYCGYSKVRQRYASQRRKVAEGWVTRQHRLLPDCCFFWLLGRTGWAAFYITGKEQQL